MDRLTRRSFVNEAFPINHLNLRHEDTTSEDTLTKILDRLAEYEDTGLTPNEIQDIKNILDTDGDGFGNKEILEIILELAKYKKTGLSPQDVTNLDDVSCRQSNAIVKMGEKIENLEKELESWKRDAIESKAKLGGNKDVDEW